MGVAAGIAVLFALVGGYIFIQTGNKFLLVIVVAAEFVLAGVFLYFRVLSVRNFENSKGRKLAKAEGPHTMHRF